jgi:hypothetical protein
MKVTEIRRTCFAYPSQWEAKTEFGYVYIRFRGGNLTVRSGSTSKDAIAAPTIFEWHDTDSYGGFIEYDELKELTSGILDLPEAESAEEPNVIPDRS